MQNYVHYPIHFVIMIIFFFHYLLFTISYFHYMYYCIIVYMLIFFCEFSNIFCKIPEELFFPMYICICLQDLHLFFIHVHLFCRVPALPLCFIGYLPKIVLYRQLFSGNALHASLIFQLC